MMSDFWRKDTQGISWEITLLGASPPPFWGREWWRQKALIRPTKKGFHKTMQRAVCGVPASEAASSSYQGNGKSRDGLASCSGKRTAEMPVWGSARTLRVFMVQAGWWARENQHGDEVQNSPSKCGLKSWPIHILAVRFWVNCFSSLRLSFFICEIEIIVLKQGIVMTEWVNTGKHLAYCKCHTHVGHHNYIKLWERGLPRGVNRPHQG